jgi:hypothetical protein
MFWCKVARAVNASLVVDAGICCWPWFQFGLEFWVVCVRSVLIRCWFCLWGILPLSLVYILGCILVLQGFLVLPLLLLSALVQWIALDRVLYKRSVWVIHLWMTGLSLYLSHLRVVFIALWLVAAAIVVDCLLWMQDWSSRSWTSFSIISLSVLTNLSGKLISLFPLAAIVLVEVFALWWLLDCSG